MTPVRERAVFYRTLAQMLSAGASVQTSIDSALMHLSRKHQIQAQQSIQPSLARGDRISRALAASALFPAHDVQYMALAEESGQLDTLLRELADFSDDIVALRRVVRSGLALPAVYLVVAAFLVPLPALVLGGSLVRYLGASIGLLAIVALPVTAIVLIFRHASGALLDRILRPLPILGAMWREFEYWNLTRTLAFLSRTSVGVIPSVHLAAASCRSPRLANVLRRAATQAEAQGTPVSPLLRAAGELPPEMVALWQTGEQSGRLDETFQRLATFFGDRSRRRLAELATWLPRIVYFVVAGYMVWQILRLAGAYIRPLTSI